MISSPIWLSRFPVGSSASSRRGRAHDGTRDRDALLLPAGELRREVVHTRAQPDALERLERRPPPLGARHAAVQQAAARRCRARRDRARGGTSGTRTRSRRLRSAASSRSRVGRHGRAAECDAPARRRVEQAHEVQQRALAAARGAHDRDELAGGHVERDVRQRHGLDPVGAVDLLDLVEVEHRGGRSPDAESRARTGAVALISVEAPSRRGSRACPTRWPRRLRRGR